MKNIPLPSFAGYGAGPTSCIANPKVLANIREQLKTGRFLSSADVNLAANLGWVSIPKNHGVGWNDGVFYPPEIAGAGLGPSMAPPGGSPPTPMASLSLPRTNQKQKLKVLVLLVDFKDNVGTTPPEHFEKLMFDAGNPGSMATFYDEMSYGKLAITGRVTEWIRAPHAYGHYTAKESGTGEKFPFNTPGLVIDALTEYCKTRSLAEFDENGDGFIDGLCLIHAGPGAEAEEDPEIRKDMIWSHKWVLPVPFQNDGVKVYAYFTTPEDGKLGVFSHEFAHFLGLPDLYDTSYKGYGVGSWCLMGAGSNLGDGDRPARLSAWCLEELGWIKPTVVAMPGRLRLKTLEKDPAQCYKLPIVGTDEYFLLENRQPSGRDIELPGGGLAVWHIDPGQPDNTRAYTLKVGLVQADGQQHVNFGGNPGDDGDLFPGSSEKKSLSDALMAPPNTRANSERKSGIALARITDSKGVVGVTIKSVST